MLQAGEPVSKDSLRAAIQDLIATFKDRYPKGQEYLSRLDLAQTADELEALQREALVANPLVSGQPVLFIARHQYASDHHNTETMFQTGEICTGKFTGPGAVKVIDLRAARPQSKTQDPRPIRPASPRCWHCPPGWPATRT
jgi:hypothetical protein